MQVDNVSGHIYKEKAVNTSKLTDPREWRKWYQSGAVPQRKYPDGSLMIMATGVHFTGPAKGHTVLSLGDVVIASGLGWSSHRTLCAVVVPTPPTRSYRLGAVLKKIPGNAVPVDVFFAHVK